MFNLYYSVCLPNMSDIRKSYQDNVTFMQCSPHQVLVGKQYTISHSQCTFSIPFVQYVHHFEHSQCDIQHIVMLTDYVMILTVPLINHVMHVSMLQICHTAWRCLCLLSLLSSKLIYRLLHVAYSGFPPLLSLFSTLGATRHLRNTVWFPAASELYQAWSPELNSWPLSADLRPVLQALAMPSQACACGQGESELAVGLQRSTSKWRDTHPPDIR